MTPLEFKKTLIKIKHNLKGVTLQMINANSTIPYFTLNEFGNAILKEEKNSNCFAITQAWTNDGVVIIKSLKHLSYLLNQNTVKAIQFRATYNPTDFAESMRYGYKLND